MQQHVKILAVLHIVLGGLGVLAGLIALLVFGGLATIINMSESHDDMFAGGILSLIGVVVMIVVFCVSVPGLIAGIGLLSYQPWARILTIMISAVELPAFPLHTALGIYGLWVLLSNEGSALFSRSAVMRGA
jgi:hypothetical protein